MHESVAIPACFTAGDPSPTAAVTKSGQCVFVSTYRTKLAGQCRLITITWFKDLLLHGLSVAVQGPDSETQYTCRIQLKPWTFWKKHGTKHFTVEHKLVSIAWDFRAARFGAETEPRSSYYVALICDGDVVLLLGDLKAEAFRKTGCRPALIDPILVSRKEHVFGRKRFSTKARFREKGGVHEISIECFKGDDSDPDPNPNPTMTIRIDGERLVVVKHLQWKFRGNESVYVDGMRIEVFWDAHDWLFGSGTRNAVFVIKPGSASGNESEISPSTSLGSILMSTQADDGGDGSGLDMGSGLGNGSGRFCLFLYAWKID
uniref:Uncharacterized protein n=1 Tax=Kalanchoe fedtschenkoi TaxID=63787 RepID=A0A7N0VJF0_KALFE